MFLHLKKRFKGTLIWYLFVAPVFLSMLLFILYPVIQSFKMSLYITNGLTQQWVGLGNYVRVLKSPEFWNALRNTVVMAIFSIGSLIILGLVVATMVEKCRWRFLSNVFRTVYFLPLVTSWVAAAFLWRYVFNPNYGLFNYGLSLIGLPPVALMESPNTAIIGVVLVAIWKGLGFFMIIFLAGLQGIPHELYESAEIDGASSFKSWLYVTIPQLWHVFVFLIINNTIGALKRFSEVYVLGGPQGSPARSIQTVVLRIYELGFGTLQFGEASATAYLLFLIILIVTILNFKFFGGKDIEG